MKEMLPNAHLECLCPAKARTQSYNFLIMLQSLNRLQAGVKPDYDKMAGFFVDRQFRVIIVAALSALLAAPLAELVDARDSKSRFFGSAGSIPAGGTTLLYCQRQTVQLCIVSKRLPAARNVIPGTRAGIDQSGA